jgi:hypothetical protein
VRQVSEACVQDAHCTHWLKGHMVFMDDSPLLLFSVATKAPP